MKKHPWLDAHEIVPGLWQGSEPTKGLILQMAGFSMVVLCARELQIPAIYFPGVEVVHAPNDDSIHFPLTDEKLRIAVASARSVADAIKAGRNVLVTCAQGLNRSGFVVALALHMLYGWSGDDCIGHVRRRRKSRKRPNLKPLSNPEFTEILRKLSPRPAEISQPADSVPLPPGRAPGR